MKTSGFKMKGYSYPGTSPLKGKRRRAAVAENKSAAAEKMDEAFGGELDKATDLMANEGFTVDAAAPPTENTLKKSPTPKRSPAKVGEEIATEVVEQTLKEQLVEAGTVAAIEGGAQLGAEALRDKKKSRRSTNMGGFSKLQFGRQ